MDSTSPLQQVRPGFVRTAYNCRPGLTGGLVKRGGAEEQLDSAWSTRKITAGMEFLVSGTRRTVLFGTDDSGSGGVVGYNNSGTVSTVKSSLTGTARPSFVQVGSLLFFFNGTTDLFLYDGSGTRQIGITAPGTAPSGSASGSGHDLSAGSYIAAYTYYNSATGAESTPTPISDPVTATSGQKITWTVSAGDSATADTIRLYRSYANGQDLYLDTTAAIASTSIESTQADAGLGDLIEIDNSRLSLFTSTAQYPVVVDSRIFVASESNEVRYSKLGQAGPMPESFPVKNFAPTYGAGGDSDRIIGLAKAGSTPVVLKERSVGALRKRGFQDFGLAEDPVLYEYEEISAEHGAVCHWASTEVLGECVFLSRDNVYATRGQQGDIRPLADAISTTIRSLGFTSSQVKRISAANNTYHKYVVFACFENNSSTNPTWLLVGDYQQYPNFRWTVYRPGTNTTTHPGWRVGSFFTLTGSTGAQELYFGNSQGDGQYYKAESSDSDIDKGIYFEVTTRPYDGRNAVSYKLWNRAEVAAQGDGNDYDLTVSAIYDVSGEEQGAEALSLDPGGAKWDAVNWDEFVWAANAVRPLKKRLHRRANYLQLVFRQTSAEAPVTLFEWQAVGSWFKVY